MTTREKMIALREENGLTPKQMGEKCGVSEVLIKMVEHGEVTHPLIAKKLQKVYKLTNEEMKELIPKIHREGDPEYEPDKYVPPEIKAPINPAALKKDIFEVYAAEHQDRMARQHQRRSRY